MLSCPAPWHPLGDAQHHERPAAGRRGKPRRRAAKGNTSIGRAMEYAPSYFVREHGRDTDILRSAQWVLAVASARGYHIGPILDT